MLIYNSPQLFAVSHVLRRLPVPRHSPYALLRLNSLFLVLFHCLSFVTVNCLGCLELLSQSLALLSFYHSRGKIVVSHFLGKTFFDLLISKNLCSIICSFACFLFIQFSMIFPAGSSRLWWAQVEHRITLQRTASLNATRTRSALRFFTFGGLKWNIASRSNVPRT